MTDRRWFALGVAVLWGLLIVQALQVPVLLDDWYQLTWYRHHDLSLSSVWDYYSYNYFHFNPRVGDAFLMIINGPKIIHVVVTPLVEMALLWLAFALSFARWPKATKRDMQLLLVLQVFIWLITPIPGVIYFYRPFTTNYLYAFATTMALFVPYRLALTHAVPPRRLWMIPIMFIVGWLAGMSNEHTGMTACAAMVCFIVWAWKTKRLRAWMISGAVGLFIGYPMLLKAPGQAERYAGVANRMTPIALLKDRGLSGCWGIVMDFIGEAQIGTMMFVGGVLLYVFSRRRAKQALTPLPVTTLHWALFFALAAGMIVCTMFGSPTFGERLLLASSVLLSCVYTSIWAHLFEDRLTRRILLAVCGVIFAYHAVRYVQVYHAVLGENEARIAAIKSTPKGEVAIVKPYKYRQRTRWHWGDDFRYASLRQYVANEVYDASDVRLSPMPGWAQPIPEDHYIAKRTYDPPLSPEEDAKLVPNYVPTYWEWDVVQLRRSLHWGPLNVPGHKLVRYIVESVGLPFDDPKHRPLRVIDWTPEKGTRTVDAYPYNDEGGRQFLRTFSDTIPKQTTDVYTVGCTGQRLVTMLPAPQAGGLLIPIEPGCRRITTAIICDSDVCWVSGRYMP